MRFLQLLAASACSLVAVAGTSGCIIAHEGPPPDPYGSFAFDWSFAGETDCAAANVSDVSVILSQGGEIAFEDDSEPCFGGGLTITDIETGTYDVDIVAFDHAGDALYETSFTVDIPDDHRTNNVGLIELQPVDGQPLSASGTLSFFWAFHYPTDQQVVEDCAAAGVTSVDVEVTPTGGQATPFSQTSPCDEVNQGLSIDGLDEGPYTLRLVAHGDYDGQDVVLYDSGDVDVDVVADQENDLGNVVLDRVPEGFSDFNVSWALADGGSCADDGVSTVTLSFQRDGEAQPEDSFEIGCSTESVLRRTFVPGHYTVTVVGEGAGATYSASVPVDLPPNSVGEVDLSLAPG